MAEDRKAVRKDKRQQNVDDVVGFLGRGAGMWFIAALGVLGVIAAVSMAITALTS